MALTVIFFFRRSFTLNILLLSLCVPFHPFACPLAYFSSINFVFLSHTLFQISDKPILLISSLSVSSLSTSAHTSLSSALYKNSNPK